MLRYTFSNLTMLFVCVFVAYRYCLFHGALESVLNYAFISISKNCLSLSYLFHNPWSYLTLSFSFYGKRDKALDIKQIFQGRVSGKRKKWDRNLSLFCRVPTTKHSHRLLLSVIEADNRRQSRKWTREE